jgi:hypothetical protein
VRRVTVGTTHCDEVFELTVWEEKVVLASRGLYLEFFKVYILTRVTDSHLSPTAGMV